MQGMIALRIWLIERQMAGVYRSRTLSPAMAALVESAALYCAALVALIATYASNSWGHYPVFDAVRDRIWLELATSDSVPLDSSANCRHHIIQISSFHF